jgi:hypothetical protein
LKNKNNFEILNSVFVRPTTFQTTLVSYISMVNTSRESAADRRSDDRSVHGDTVQCCSEISI